MEIHQIITYLRRHFFATPEEMAKIVASQSWGSTRETAQVTLGLHHLCVKLWGSSYSELTNRPHYGPSMLRYCPLSLRGAVYSNATVLGEKQHYLKTILEIYGRNIAHGTTLNKWVEGLKELRIQSRRNMTTTVNLLENNYYNIVANYALNSLFICDHRIDRKLVAMRSATRMVSELQSIMDNGGIPLFVNVDDIAFIGEHTPVHIKDYTKVVTKKLGIFDAQMKTTDKFSYADVNTHYGLRNGTLSEAKIERLTREWNEFINNGIES